MTDRDNNIVKHFEKYKYGTVRQIEMIYFPDIYYSRDIARRRLEVLTNSGYLKKFSQKNQTTVYAINDKKIDRPCQPSRLILLNLYATLIQEGLKVEVFKLEHFFLGGAVRTDAVLAYSFLDRRYNYLVECNISNHPANLEKYDYLAKYKEAQELLGIDFFPRILFISDRVNNVKLASTNIVQITTTLKPFGVMYL